MGKERMFRGQESERKRQRERSYLFLRKSFGIIILDF
jgi:hypothetical protein